MSGIFEISKKACLFRNIQLCIFDDPLINGRRPDIKVELDNKTVYLECAVITDSDQDRADWDNFMETVKNDPAAVKSGVIDPLYHCHRFYRVIFDKLAKDMDLNACQASNDHPNVFLISFDHPRTPLPIEHLIGIFLDELFSNLPTGSKNKYSVEDWLKRKAKKLISAGRLDSTNFRKNYGDLVRAPKKLSGILVFNNHSLVETRMNYYAREQCRLSHQQMAKIEKVLSSPSKYA